VRCGVCDRLILRHSYDTCWKDSVSTRMNSVVEENKRRLEIFPMCPGVSCVMLCLCRPLAVINNLKRQVYLVLIVEDRLPPST
jgi:hypothetical protein